jgi:maleate isomerase
VHAERHLGIRDNFAFAQVTEPQIDAMIRAVVREKARAVAIVCTNLKAARLEVELGVPIYGSVAITLWKSLQAAGIAPDRIRGWGRLLGDPV